MNKTFHVVPHSHWDREWYFTTSRSKVYLMQDLKEVLDTLETNDSFNHFVLDGQASLLEDYLAWRPQDKARIQKLVKDGSLIIGPWYTQTDQLVISGESIVRNLLYGINICETFGDYLNVGYVPDSFGQAASMPQIYQEFGIEDTLFWRGVSNDEMDNTEFIWTGEDGSKVYAYQIPSGYYIGGNLPEKDNELKAMLQAEPFTTLIERASTDNIYFPNGFDQAPIRQNLPEIVEKLNTLYPDDHFEISSIQRYINAVKSDKNHWDTVHGELVNGKLMRIHKTIFSSRSDLKALNTQIQNYLVNVMEPLLSVAYTLGFEYPTETVDTIWKLMFENAAHDSIGSCVSDTTNEDVYMRYKQARDISTNLVELTLRNVATHIHNPSKKEITFTVFNPLDQTRADMVYATVYIPSETFGLAMPDGTPVPYTLLELQDQTDYVKTQTIRLNPSEPMYIPDTIYCAKIAIAAQNLPSMGYVQLTVDLNGNTYTPLQKAEDTTLENEHYKITLNEQGSLDILDKHNQYVYKNQAVLQENGDDGDSFNYSPPREDMVIQSTDSAFTAEMQKSAIMQIMHIHYDMVIPQNLAERAEQQATLTWPVTLTVKIKEGCPIIDFSLKTQNAGLSHRLCVLFDTNIASKTSIADQQFGVLKRPVYLQHEMDLYNTHLDDWNEMPIAIETCQSFVSLADTERGMAVFPKGVREYEIVGKKYDTIRLTLFRTYGHMGKENLLYRKGRASGETVIATPDAQLLKPLQFDFSVYYYHTSFEDNRVAQVAKISNTPAQNYQYAPFLNGRLIFSRPEVQNPTLPVCFSLLESHGELVLSTLKKAEQQTGLIIRYYNGSLEKEETMTLTLNPDYLNAAARVNLKEEETSRLNMDGDTLNLRPTPHAKLVSLYLSKTVD